MLAKQRMPRLTWSLDRHLAAQMGLAERATAFLGLVPHETSRIEAQAILLRPPVRSGTKDSTGVDIYAMDEGELHLYFWAGVLVVAELGLGKVSDTAYAWEKWGEGEGQAQGNELFARRWSPGGRVMEVSRDGEVIIRAVHPDRIPRQDHFAAYGLAPGALKEEAKMASGQRAVFCGLVPGLTRRQAVDSMFGKGVATAQPLSWAPRRLRRKVSSQLAYTLPGGEVVASFDGELLLCLSLGDRTDSVRQRPPSLGEFLPPAVGQRDVHLATNGIVWVEGQARPRIYLCDPVALRDAGALYRVDGSRVFLVVVIALLMLGVGSAVWVQYGRSSDVRAQEVQAQQVQAQQVQPKLEQASPVTDRARRAALPNVCASGDLPSCDAVVNLGVGPAEVRAARTKLCEGGRRSHCEAAAVAITGKGSEEGRRRTALRERGCAAGAQDACIGLAVELMAPGASQAALQRAYALLSSACNDFEGAACVALVRGHMNRRWGPPPAGELRRLLKKGCDAGHAKSCELLVSNLTGGLPASTRGLTGEARDAQWRACELGAKESCLE